jgi:AraC family transcriptional regulator, regulatory protein of adaptative response / methylated-DNA-[protein]-cysteine methyltransferase
MLIHWTTIETSLGTMLVAASDKGICRLSFDEGEADVRRRFPSVELRRADPGVDWVRGAAEAAENPATLPDLPLDVAGTPFQQAVWAELRRIPAGETRSYADIAKAVGQPKAVRAAGTANGANKIAILIPCHRVIRSDGTLGGYAYGLERKRVLLEREGCREFKARGAEQLAFLSL